MEYFDNLLRPGSKYGVKEDVSGRTESFRVNQGYFFVGMSDAEGNECWGLHQQSGRFYRMHADVSSEQISLRPPPAGYPDGAMTQVMFDDKGRPAHLAGRVEGTTIDPIVDSEDRLAFRVNGGPLLPTVAVFLPGATLRKWILVVDSHDRIVMAQRGGVF